MKRILRMGMVGAMHLLALSIVLQLNLMVRSNESRGVFHPRKKIKIVQQGYFLDPKRAYGDYKQQNQTPGFQQATLKVLSKLLPIYTWKPQKLSVTRLLVND